MKIRIKNPIWGVPITFLYSWYPKQFEIVECTEPLIKTKDAQAIGKPIFSSRTKGECLKLYHRLLIRKK